MDETIELARTFELYMYLIERQIYDVDDLEALKKRWPHVSDLIENIINPPVG